MATTSHIEWTEMTWNPVRGCTRVSEGCRNCYAERIASRFSQNGRPYEGLAVITPAGPRWTNSVRMLPELLEQPLHWRRPRTVFVNSMSDLFHDDVPTPFVARVFEVMASTPQHTYQLLTKRSKRLVRVASELEWPSNVWMGVSVENDSYSFRADHLRSVPAAVRFLSVEPMLGPVPSLDLEGIRWVIAGGESGPGARPIRREWLADLRDRCLTCGVAFFFKQWGGRTPKAGGRELDGRTWDELPPVSMAV
jgi:protein gp37